MNFWRHRNVFITGATGLLGSCLVDNLLNREAHVVCLLRDWVPESRFIADNMIARSVVVRGELEDYPLLVRALNEHEVDTVLHLGAQTIVGTASRSPISTFESNIRGTWNLLEACRSLPLVERVVIASSDKAYGAHKTLPYTEELPLQGRFPYDVSKSCTDLIAKSYFHTFGTPVAITRCGNIFGAGDLNFSQLIPSTIRSAFFDESPVLRSDGTMVRDYFYVQDAVEAYLLLAERLPQQGVVGEAFNFGTETPRTVLQIVETVLELMGKSHLSLDIRNQASHEIEAQYLDCKKARTRLLWKPVYSFEQGLEKTIQWYCGWLSKNAATS